MWERLLHHLLRYPFDLVTELITVLPAVVGFIRIKYLRKETKFLLTFFVILFVRDFASNLYASSSINNLYLYNLSAIIEIITLTTVFFYVLQGFYRRIAVLLFGTLFFFVDIFFWKSNDFASTIITLARLVGIPFVLFYFHELLLYMNVKYILKHPMFWISNGIIIQSTGTFFIYAVLSKEMDLVLFDTYWLIIQTIHIIFCVLSAVGFWFSKFDEEKGV